MGEVGHRSEVDHLEAGLEGVSRKAWRRQRQAAAHWSRSRPSTRTDSTPNRGRMSVTITNNSRTVLGMPRERSPAPRNRPERRRPLTFRLRSPGRPQRPRAGGAALRTWPRSGCHNDRRCTGRPRRRRRRRPPLLTVDEPRCRIDRFGGLVERASGEPASNQAGRLGELLGKHQKRTDQPCRQGNPACFQPVVRWPSASRSPSKPSVTLNVWR